jgi:hypothetical protein
MTATSVNVVENDASYDAINDYFYTQGWTDGLPIVPPTEARVSALLTGMPTHDPEELISVVPPKMGRATLRQTTTHAGAPLIIVNGPIVQTLRINCGTGLFGPGWRANATIGRALRLVLVNVGGAGPGVDASQTGHPGKYTYCIGEYEAANPWEPLHVTRGFRREQNVVTVVNAEAPHSMTENIQTDPAEIMRTFASSMATLGVNNLYSQGHPVVVLGLEHVQHLSAAGWNKRDIQQALFEMARQPWGLMKNRGKSKGPRFPEFVDQSDDTSMVPIMNAAEDLIVIVGGGAGGKSMFLPTAGGQSLSVSKIIE